MKASPHQLDLFLEPLFPVRAATGRLDLDRWRSRLKREMSRAIRECPHDRPTIAARMAQYLGLPGISKAMVDAYTAESNASHDISLIRFSAFVHATGATWLWDVVIADHGATLLIGDEARLAEVARLQQEQEAIKAQLRTLRAAPVSIRRGRP